MPNYIARFTTKCPYCNETIQKGQDRIVFVPNVSRSAVHQRCFEQIKNKEGMTLEAWIGKNPQGQGSEPTGKGSSPSSSGKSPFDFKLSEEGQASPQSGTDKELAKALKDIEQLVQKRLNQAIPRMEMGKKAIEEKLEKAAQEKMEEAVQKFVKKTITIEQPNFNPITIEGVHKNFEELLQLIACGEHVYAWGPAGGGKSTGAKQAADALQKEYAYISLNPQTPESRLLGFIDANGVYRATPFRKVYENGGVFCIDELDNASPSLLTTLNGCLENGTAAFPDQMIQAHKDFIVVATGNTCGRGGDQFFPERRPFDAAFAERFTFLFWDYDEQLERQIAIGFNPNANEWVDWVQKVREYVKSQIIRLTVSPRASIKGARLTVKHLFEPLDIAEKVMFKGLNKDEKMRILGNVGPPPKVKALDPVVVEG